MTFSISDKECWDTDEDTEKPSTSEFYKSIISFLIFSIFLYLCFIYEFTLKYTIINVFAAAMLSSLKMP